MTPAETGNAARTTPEERPPSLDTTFELLANGHRRALVAYLLGAQRGLSVEVLVDRLADDPADERRIATRLYHVHLPKLAAAGVIEWDDEREYVEPTPLVVELEPFLQAAIAFNARVR